MTTINRKFIVTIEILHNNDEGSSSSTVVKTGILSADSRWDAMKAAKKVAKKEAKKNWILHNDPVFFWETNADRRGIGACFRKKHKDFNSWSTFGVMVKVHPLSVEEDGIAWAE